LAFLLVDGTKVLLCYAEIQRALLVTQ